MMFADKLKELRRNKGLSQNDLAKQLNISQTAIGNYEAGIRKPDLEMLQCIAAYFNVTTDEMLNFDPNNYKKTTSSQLGENVEVGITDDFNGFTPEQIDFIKKLISKSN